MTSSRFASCWKKLVSARPWNRHLESRVIPACKRLIWRNAPSKVSTSKRSSKEHERSARISACGSRAPCSHFNNNYDLFCGLDWRAGEKSGVSGLKELAAFRGGISLSRMYWLLSAPLGALCVSAVNIFTHYLTAEMQRTQGLCKGQRKRLWL